MDAGPLRRLHALSDGEHTLLLYRTRRQSRKYEPRDDNAYYHCGRTPPDAAIIDNVAKDGTTVNGTAEAGSTVSIYDPAGSTRAPRLPEKITTSAHAESGSRPTASASPEARAYSRTPSGNIGPATEFAASDSRKYPAQPTIATVTDERWRRYQAA